MNLRWKDFHSKKIPVHSFGLKNQSACRLIEQTPKHTDKKDQGNQFSDYGHALLAEDFLEEGGAFGRDMSKFFSSHPKKQGGESHQRSRNTEGKVWTMPLQHPRDEKIGDDRAKIDRKIKDVEYTGDQMLVFWPELISDVGRYAGLDSAGAQRNEPQSTEKPELHDPANPHQRKAQVSKAIDDGKGNDRSVFTEKSICYDSPQKWGQINRGIEPRNIGRRVSLRKIASPENPEIIGEKNGQGRFHAIE